MIKVQVGETLFYCDTANEAAEIATLMGSRKSHKLKKEQGFLTNTNDDITFFISKINALNSTDVSSGTLAKALDVSINGLGPKLRGISRRFENKYNEPLENYVRREGRPGQSSTWKLNKRALEKISIYD